MHRPCGNDTGRGPARLAVMTSLWHNTRMGPRAPEVVLCCGLQRCMLPRFLRGARAGPATVTSRNQHGGYITMSTSENLLLKGAFNR